MAENQKIALAHTLHCSARQRNYGFMADTCRKSFVIAMVTNNISYRKHIARLYSSKKNDTSVTWCQFFGPMRACRRIGLVVLGYRKKLHITWFRHFPNLVAPCLTTWSFFWYQKLAGDNRNPNYTAR